MPSDKAIQSGYLVKLGAKVKNWKLRWMVLQGTGKLIYFKKPPAKVDIEDAQGVLNVQADVVELILWDRTVEKGLVKWPADAIPNSGFALRTRQGRLWCMHSESVEACRKWIAAVRSVGANIVFYEDTLDSFQKLDATLGADSDEEDTPEVNSSGAAGASGSSESSASTPEAKYVHKVIGGMVVKTENK